MKIDNSFSMPQTFAPPRPPTLMAMPTDPFRQPPSPPPSGPAVPPKPTSPLEPPPSRRSGRGMFALLIVLVLALVGGGTALAYYLWIQQQPKTPPKPPVAVTPDSMLQDVMNAWSQAKSFHGEYDVALMLQAAPGSDLAAEFASARFPDNRMQAKLQVSYDAANVAGALQSAGTVRFNVPLPDAIPFNGMTLSPQIAFVGVGTSTSYFRVQSLPKIPGVDFSSLQDQWVKIDAQELAAAAGESSAAQQEQLQKRLTELYRQNPFIVADNVESGNAVDGVPTRHFTLAFNRERSKTFFNAAWSELVGQRPEYAGGVSSAIQEQMTDFIDAVQLSGELWAGQEDNLPRQVKATLTYAVPGEEQGKTEGTLTVTVDAQLNNFGAPMVVTAPATSMPYQDFMTKAQLLMMSAFISGGAAPMVPSPEMPSATSPGPEIPATLVQDSDGDGLTDVEEAAYGTNHNVADTDNDGYSDGTEVQNGYDPNGPGKLNGNP